MKGTNMKTNPTGHIGHSSKMGPSLNGLTMPRPPSARRRQHDSAHLIIDPLLAGVGALASKPVRFGAAGH